jgi:AAHS family 4-hydroxybenzoate transporter-like MFS transporter
MEGRAITTLLLWGCMFFSFYLIWIILSWAPTLLRQSGATVQQYSISFFFINVGSAISTIMIGRLMDKYNKFGVLVTSQLLAYGGFVIFGLFAGSPFIIIAIVSVVSGFFIFASNSGVMALGTITYPVDIRTTGLGWAYAVGKVGSMIAPMIGGWCIAQKWSVSQICSVNGLAAVVVMVCVIALWKHLNLKDASAQAAQAAGAR